MTDPDCLTTVNIDGKLTEYKRLRVQGFIGVQHQVKFAYSRKILFEKKRGTLKILSVKNFKERPFVIINH